MNHGKVMRKELREIERFIDKICLRKPDVVDAQRRAESAVAKLRGIAAKMDGGRDDE
jgi:ribosomal protein L31E